MYKVKIGSIIINTNSFDEHHNNVYIDIDDIEREKAMGLPPMGECEIFKGDTLCDDARILHYKARFIRIVERMNGESFKVQLCFTRR